VEGAYNREPTFTSTTSFPKMETVHQGGTEVCIYSHGVTTFQ